MAGGTEAECRIVRIDTRLCPSAGNVCALKFFVPTICARSGISLRQRREREFLLLAPDTPSLYTQRPIPARYFSAGANRASRCR